MWWIAMASTYAVSLLTLLGVVLLRRARREEQRRRRVLGAFSSEVNLVPMMDTRTLSEIDAGGLVLQTAKDEAIVLYQPKRAPLFH